MSDQGALDQRRNKPNEARIKACSASIRHHLEPLALRLILSFGLFAPRDALVVAALLVAPSQSPAPYS